MRSVFRYEILKTYVKWRSWIAFVAVGAVVPLVEIALRLQGDSMIRAMTRGIASEFLLVGNLMNGYYVTYFLMNTLWIHIPFLITLGAGDQLAGEATGGTFRLLLIRPVSRTAIFYAKYLTTLLYTLTIVAFLGVLSVGLGVALFGTGPLLITGEMLVILPQSEVEWRLLVAFVLALWGCGPWPRSRSSSPRSSRMPSVPSSGPWRCSSCSTPFPTSRLTSLPRSGPTSSPLT